MVGGLSSRTGVPEKTTLMLSSTEEIGERRQQSVALILPLSCQSAADTSTQLAGARSGSCRNVFPPTRLRSAKPAGGGQPSRPSAAIRQSSTGGVSTFWPSTCTNTVEAPASRCSCTRARVASIPRVTSACLSRSLPPRT